MPSEVTDSVVQRFRHAYQWSLPQNWSSMLFLTFTAFRIKILEVIANDFTRGTD